MLTNDREVAGEEMEMEEIIEHVGFGKFQWRLLIIGMIFAAVGCTHATMTVFLLFSQDSRCAVPGIANDTYNIQSDYHRYRINQTIPHGENGKCYVYALNDTDGAHTPTESGDDARLEPCTEWVYDDSVMETTMVEDFNLVCDDVLRIPHGTMVFFLGFLVGAFGLGLVGDRFGRRLGSLIPCYIQIVCALSIAAVQSYTPFLILRFLVGVCVAGSFCNTFGVVLEIAPKHKRVLCLTMMDGMWPVGGVIGAIMAYFIRDWRYLQIAYSLPNLMVIPAYWFIPESIRWLVEKGRMDEAHEQLQVIGRQNKVDVSHIKIKRRAGEAATNESFFRIFSEPVLITRFAVIGLNWIAVAMVYYGLTLNAGSIGGSVFLNYGISVFVEIPGHIVVQLLADRMGRKKLQIFLMLLTSATCLATMFPVMYDGHGLQILTTVLSMFGKFTVSGAFFLVYVYTPELFPTTLRISALGAASCLARFGSMSAPYIGEIGRFVEGSVGVALPLIIFSAFTMVAGLLCVFLPETYGVEIPANIEAVRRQKREDMKAEDSRSIHVEMVPMTNVVEN